MVDELNQGLPGAVTVDGPKGPAKKVKTGILTMAKQANAVIIPYTVKSSRYIEFKSWDLFQLPYPFSRIVVDYGPAFDKKSEDLVALSSQLEELMIQQEERVKATLQ